MVGGGSGHPIDVARRLRRELRVCIIEVTSGQLESESRAGEKGDSRRHRIKYRQIEIAAILVGLASVEYRRLHFPLPVINACGNQAESDVGGVEPVMRDW